MIHYWAKNLHIATVAFNIGFFLLRYYWMINNSRLTRKRWVRSLSVFNDTLLLIAGIALAILISKYPFQAHWLTAKLAGLLVYIALGSIALTYGRNKTLRVITGFLALLSIAYIVMVARYRTADILGMLGIL
ncbi:MAG: SirB2 family protein [Candidatus Sedimenticola sp. 6PFRAG7]